MNKEKFQDALINACNGCAIQSNGWPCGTCFFSISDNLKTKHWQSVLYFRGDYKKSELNHLPKDIKPFLKEVYFLCGGQE